MAKVRQFLLDKLHWLVVGGVALIVVLFLIFGHTSENGKYITLDGSDAQITEGTKEFIKEAQKAVIDYAETAVPTVIINNEGEEETIEAPTIDSIDGGEIFNAENCPEGEECGLGAFIYAPTDTYEHFKDYTYGKCWNLDGFAGSQCWDLSSLHSVNYTKDKRVFSTCGTGAARGMWDCKEQNAGTEYELVDNIYNTNVGDIGVWEGGTYGHTCIIAGPVVNGYVACYGQNQGGSACPGGGAAANIINLSISGFRGAFHPKTYVGPTPPSPEPQPEPQSGDKINYTYIYGDYFSKVLVKLGLDENNLWGENGSVKFYTAQLIEQNMLDYRGNVLVGVPFTLTRR